MADDRKVPAKSDREKGKEANFYGDIGFTLQTERMRCGMTQKDVGDKLFTSVNTVSMFERGQAKIRAYELKLFCEITGVEPNKLLRFEGKKNTGTDFKIMGKLANMEEGEKKKVLDILNIMFPSR